MLNTIIITALSTIIVGLAKKVLSLKATVELLDAELHHAVVVEIPSLENELNAAHLQLMAGYCSHCGTMPSEFKGIAFAGGTYDLCEHCKLCVEVEKTEEILSAQSSPVVQAGLITASALVEWRHKDPQEAMTFEADNYAMLQAAAKASCLFCGSVEQLAGTVKCASEPGMVYAMCQPCGDMHYQAAQADVDPWDGATCPKCSKSVMDCECYR